MRPRRSHDPSPWPAITALLLMLALMPAVAPLGAQEEGVQDDPATEVTEGEAVTLDLEGEGAQDDLEGPDIDEILAGDEAVLEGGGFTYDPGDRRDPFKSLLLARDNDEPQGPRPEGVPGLLIDEITVSGIFRTVDGWVAQVQASNQDKSYLITVDDQLYDGDVLSISRNEVVFKQIVQDPTALKPFREVPKKLNP